LSEKILRNKDVLFEKGSGQIGTRGFFSEITRFFILELLVCTNFF